MAIELELETRKLELTCSDPYAAIFLSRCIPEVRVFFFFFFPSHFAYEVVVLKKCK